MKSHKIKIIGAELFVDDLKIKGLTSYKIQAHIDQESQSPECRLDLSINVDLSDVQLSM